MPADDSNRSQYEPVGLQSLVKQASTTSNKFKLNLTELKSINNVTDILGWEKRQDAIENKLKSIREINSMRKEKKQKEHDKKWRESQIQKEKRIAAEEKAAKNRAIIDAKNEAKKKKELEALWKHKEFETKKAGEKVAKEYVTKLLNNYREAHINEQKANIKIKKITEEIKKRFDRELKAAMLAKELKRIEEEKLQKERQKFERKLMTYEDAWSKERMIWEAE